MAQEKGGNLSEVQARIGASHNINDLDRKLQFYGRWAPDYDQDVAALQYRAPRLAVDCLTQALPGPPHDALILDVACGTGLVAAELKAMPGEASGEGQASLGLTLLASFPSCPSPGGLVCLTTRTNPSNLQYKEALEATLDKLEQAGAWKRLVAQTVDHWELATSPLEVAPGAKDGFISGIIYLYQKQRSP
uniref:Uncharacterized protein n=1 Tax=Spermophilus dauricus TaxID=99837 RepID=A0A8C9Q7S4_SPEDA